MNSLDLNACGIQEMDALDLIGTNGGDSPSTCAVTYMTDEQKEALGDAVTVVGYFLYGFVVGFFD